MANNPSVTRSGALKQQAQSLAEAALAALPEDVRAKKMEAVMSGILQRLQEREATSGSTHVSVPEPSRPPPPPSCQQQQQRVEALETVGAAELCGDEPWYASEHARGQLRRLVTAAHAEQKILVRTPVEEIKRICLLGGRTLGARAVLRMGGSHHGGYGEADINYAYRQLARALHPDKNPHIPEAPDAFRRLSEAADELREGLAESRNVVQRLAGVMGVKVTPEMLERPQGALLAEALRLFAAVLGVTGEGKIPKAVLERSLVNFSAAAHGCKCSAGAIAEKWFVSGDLLDSFSSTAVRDAYDCAPKRHRAQFLCALNRVSKAEARQNENCMRGTWQKVLAQFPELNIWNELLHKLRGCIWTIPDDVHSEETDPENSNPKLSTWAQDWRGVISDVLPCGMLEAAPHTDKEVRRLAATLWHDMTIWLDRECDASRHFELFKFEKGPASIEAMEWAFIPATDLLLLVGEGMVGCSAEGLFTSEEKSGRRSFYAARRAHGLAPKRGLTAENTEEQRNTKRTKLNRGPTRVVLLTNMVGPGEVDSNLEKETAEEASKYGLLKSCTVKESIGAPDNEAVRIFLEYTKADHASKAYADMNGRYFGGRVVKARFYDEARYAQGDLERRIPSRVLLVTNLVGAEEVDADFQDETAEEACKFGKLQRCIVKMNGVCKDEAVQIFLEYEHAEDATNAFTHLNGRLYGDRTVKAKYFEEDMFRKEVSCHQ